MLYAAQDVSSNNPTQTKIAQSDQNGISVAFVMALDSHEISVATLALQEKLDKDVADYAAMLQADHQSNLKEVEAISADQSIAPIENAFIVKFSKRGKHDLEKMRKVDNDKFQTVFLKAMVKGHAEALEKLNSFSQSVTNEELKAFLTKTATAVKHHLTLAETLLKSKKSL